MVRLDLAFLLCCCKAILGPLQGSKDEENFYQLLGVERDASPEDIKRAYKRQSLQMHPDKLAQRGKVVTDEDRTRFTRMKEAYEVLSDPHKRETYDAVGERGMKWLNEPFSMDPRELINNFATSSTLDKSKIFGIFVVLFVAILLLPILVCLQTDHVFGDYAKWTLVLLPLWIWDALILLYHIRVIMLGPIPKPEDMPEEEWVDPLPMSKRYLALGRFILVVSFEVALALQLDEFIHLQWRLLLLPFILLEGFIIVDKIVIMATPIITVQELEQKMGKPFNSQNLTANDKEFIKRFFVVPSMDGLEHLVAIGLKRAAKRDTIKSIFRSIIIVLVGAKLDQVFNSSWWVIFSPFWILVILTCCGNVQYFAEMSTQVAAMEEAAQSKMDGSKDVENQDPSQGYIPVSDSYMGSASQEQSDKREEMQVQLALLRKQFVASCCSQILFVLLLSLIVAKLEGASYSSLWLISPLILFASVILCIIGCAIYGFNAPTRDENATEWEHHESHVTMNYAPPNKPIATVIRPPPISAYERIDEMPATYIPPIIISNVVIGANAPQSSGSTFSETVDNPSSNILLDFDIGEEPLSSSTGVHPITVSIAQADEEEPGILQRRPLSHKDPATINVVDGNESVVTADMNLESEDIDTQLPERYIHDLD